MGIISIEYERKIFHSFKIDDWFPVEYHQSIANDWFETEEGQWIKKHCINLEIIKYHDYATNTYRYKITAYIKPSDYTFYKIKFST